MAMEVSYETGVSTGLKTNAVRKEKVTNTFQISNEKKVSKRELVKENLKARINELLDLKDNFLNISIVGKNGKIYLQLTRPNNDRLRSNERHDFNMSAIKNKLGLKDEVLKRNNDLKDITGRNLYEESGSATLECGKSLMIPLSELGKDFSWYQFGKKDLVDYVKAYLECN